MVMASWKVLPSVDIKAELATKSETSASLALINWTTAVSLLHASYNFFSQLIKKSFLIFLLKT